MSLFAYQLSQVFTRWCYTEPGRIGFSEGAGTGIGIGIGTGKGVMEVTGVFETCDAGK